MRSNKVPFYFVLLIGILFTIWKSIEIYTYPAKNDLKAVNGTLLTYKEELEEPVLNIRGVEERLFLTPDMKSTINKTLTEAIEDKPEIEILINKSKPDYIDQEGEEFFVPYQIVVNSRIITYEQIKDIKSKTNFKGLCLGIILCIISSFFIFFTKRKTQ